MLKSESMQRPLFQKYDIFGVQQHQAQEAKRIAAGIQPERLSEDLDKLAAEIASELTMELPTLNEGGAYTSDKQIKVDARRVPGRIVFDRGHPVLIDATEITFHVPFTGDPAVFDVQPSTHNMNPPIADVDKDKSELLIVQHAFDENTPVKAQYDRTLQEIKQHLEWLRPGATQTETMRQAARLELEKRKQANSIHRKIVDSIGLPKRPSDKG
jgi:hypothetical protein